MAEQVDQRDAADCRKRQRRHDQQRITDAAEIEVNQQKDQREGQRHDKLEARLGVPEIFEMSRPGDGIAGRRFHLGGGGLQIADNRGQVAAMGVDIDPASRAGGARVRASFISSYRTYGARRVWHDVLAEGQPCRLHRIERLIRQQAPKARPRRHGLPKDDGQRSVIAENVLDRQFSAEAPNRKWVADFPCIWTAEGWLYVAAVIDLFSRRVVGWSMSATMTAQLVTDALMMAIWRRGKPDALLHHSDQGSQYTSEQFERLMADNGVTCSMSRSGNVWDNAAMESLLAAPAFGSRR